MTEAAEHLIQELLDPNNEEAFFTAKKLAKIADGEVGDRLLSLIEGGDVEQAHLSCLTLSLMATKQDYLPAILEKILDPENTNASGSMVQLLEEFDLSESFVSLFRVYLFGTFKASSLAKEYLDYEEFDITERTIRKSEKHWKHYQNNAGNDTQFETKSEEVEAMLNDIRSFLEG